MPETDRIVIPFGQEVEWRASPFKYFIDKGRKALISKSLEMEDNWHGKKGDMIQGFGKMPFGPNRKANYMTGVNRAKYRNPNPDKWATEWERSMIT